MAGPLREGSSFQEKPLNRPEKANIRMIAVFGCEENARA